MHKRVRIEGTLQNEKNEKKHGHFGNYNWVGQNCGEITEDYILKEQRYQVKFLS